ncbi:MAG: ATP-binding protein [Bacteroidales bacterium]
MDADDRKYIRTLIGQGEHDQLDFKFEISDARKIARTLSAFSNTRGGRLLIGVKDNGRIAGIRSDEEYYMLESAATLHCRPAVAFESRKYLVDGKQVLEAYIPPVENKPVFARDDRKRWMAYIRVGDENFLAHIVQLNLWKEEQRSEGQSLVFDRSQEILLDFLRRLGPGSLETLVRETGMKRKALIHDLTVLVRFDVLELYHREGEVLFKLRDTPGRP